jgi:hypothetical protein
MIGKELSGLAHCYIVAQPTSQFPLTHTHQA